MPFTVTMPKLSPTMEEGSLAKWHKKEGEFVKADELLLEIATDKATVEYNTLDEGWLRKILVPEGGNATINQPIAVFTVEESESIEGYVPEGETPEPQVEEEAPVKEEEAPKAKPQPVAATPTAQPAFVPEPPLEKMTLVKGPEGKVRASPLAKRLAKKRGLDLTTVKGSGPAGRITSKDLERAQPAGLVAFGRQEEPKDPPGAYDEIPLTPMRKVIGRRLQESKSFIPHFYVKQTVDAEPLVNLREQLKNADIRVTFNDLILRACALALREHPGVNSGFNSVNQSVIQFKTIDISVAVTFDGGLITPIVRYADYKNVGEISLEVKELAARAKKGKLAEHEYKGGSFCISNLGMYGISEFSAVINPPQSAILAVGGIEACPVVRDGEVVAGKTLALTLSVDHRVVDGALAAEFIKTLQHLVENPSILLI